VGSLAGPGFTPPQRVWVPYLVYDIYVYIKLYICMYIWGCPLQACL
jgi:hypothetical protein